MEKPITSALVFILSGPVREYSYHKSEVPAQQVSMSAVGCVSVGVHNPCQVLSRLGGLQLKARSFLRSRWAQGEAEGQLNCGIQVRAGSFAPRYGRSSRRQAQQTLSYEMLSITEPLWQQRWLNSSWVLAEKGFTLDD